MGKNRRTRLPRSSLLTRSLDFQSCGIERKETPMKSRLSDRLNGSGSRCSARRVAMKAAAEGDWGPDRLLALREGEL